MRAVFALAAAAALLPLAAADAAPKKKPNLLFMMADQLRYDTQGAVWKGANTPNLDALGAGQRLVGHAAAFPAVGAVRAEPAAAYGAAAADQRSHEPVVARDADPCLRGCQPWGRSERQPPRATGATHHRATPCLLPTAMRTLR